MNNQQYLVGVTYEKELVWEEQSDKWTDLEIWIDGNKLCYYLEGLIFFDSSEELIELLEVLVATLDTHTNHKDELHNIPSLISNLIQQFDLFNKSTTVVDVYDFLVDQSGIITFDNCYQIVFFLQFFICWMKIINQQKGDVLNISKKGKASL